MIPTSKVRLVVLERGVGGEGGAKGKGSHRIPSAIHTKSIYWKMTRNRHLPPPQKHSGPKRKVLNFQAAQSGFSVIAVAGGAAKLESSDDLVVLCPKSAYTMNVRAELLLPRTIVAGLVIALSSTALRAIVPFLLMRCTTSQQVRPCELYTRISLVGRNNELAIEVCSAGTMWDLMDRLSYGVRPYESSRKSIWAVLLTWPSDVAKGAAFVR